MEVRDKDMYDSTYKGKRRIGKVSLLQYLEGKRITRYKAIQAKCYDCDGMGETGKCDIINCPLYPYSPYRNKGVGK